MGKMDTAKIILDAVKDADKEYYNMSGGVGVNDNGVETFISAKIAQKVYRNSNKIGANIWISLEERFDMLLDYSQADRRGGLAKDYSGSKKVDVAIYRNGKLYFVTEVKRGISFNKISNDVGRIDYLLNRMGRKSGSLKFGLMAGIARSLEGRKSPQEQMQDTLEKIQDEYKNLKVSIVPTKIHSENKRFNTNRDVKVNGVMPYCFLLEAKHHAN